MEKIVNKNEKVNVTYNNLEEMRKGIVQKYFELGLVEDKRNDKGYVLMSKEELDDWEWD